MKSLFGFILVLVLGLVSGGAYILLRPTEKRTSDWQRLKAVPSNVGNYFTSLFTTHAVIDEPAAAPKAA